MSVFIRETLIRLVIVLIFSIHPPALLSVVHAARITAPGLHVKASMADAKTNAYWPSDPVLCDLVLDGDVAEGDVASVEQKFQAIVGTQNSFSFFLCLRSTGGDLREAVKIAQFVLRTQRPSIATVIEDGQTCASACAVIFLAGNAPARVGAWPQRFLHPRGKLLFHSTRLDFGKSSDKDLLAWLAEPTADPRGLKGKILDLYKNGLSDVQSVIATFQKPIFQREDVGDRWVRPSLFLETFAQDPDEWICIDNVDAVGRWNIQTYGYQPARPATKQNYANVCRSAYQWRSDRFAAGREDELTDEGELKRPARSAQLAGPNMSNIDFDDRFSMSFQAAYQPLTCVVELRDTKEQLNSASTLTTYFLAGNGGTLGTTVEQAPTAFYPAATLLRDLPGIRPSPDRSAGGNRPAAGFSEYPNSTMNGCSYRTIPKMEGSACQAACATDPDCKAYSRNKITQACELKHTLTALRLDPLWVSGAPSAGPAPGRSIRANAMVNLYDAGIRKNVSLVGRRIDEMKVEDVDACTDRCNSDSKCLAQEFGESTGVCRRFSEVTGFAEPPVGGDTFSIEFKKQQ